MKDTDSRARGRNTKVDNVDAKVRYFLKIAQYSSLSRAADVIGISQSGLSRQLATLESFLGNPLFERTGHGIRLTSADEKLRAGTQSQYDAIDAILLFMHEKEGITDGKLRVATTYTIGLGFVSGLLDTFISGQTGVNLSITSGGSPDVLDLVEKKRADIGFLYDSTVVSNLVESLPLFDSHMCLVIRGDETTQATTGDISSHRPPLISYPKTYALREMLRSAGLEDQIVAEANTLEVILQLAASGIGQCILPERLPDRMLHEYGLIKIRPISPPLKRRVVAIIRNDCATALVRSLFERARNLSEFNEDPQPAVGDDNRAN